jgi:hypothetical protein
MAGIWPQYKDEHRWNDKGPRICNQPYPLDLGQEEEEEEEEVRYVDDKRMKAATAFGAAVATKQSHARWKAKRSGIWSNGRAFNR